MVSDLANTLVRTFLAPACLGCHRILDRPLAGPICPSCRLAVSVSAPPWCETCGDAMPSWREPADRCARCRRRPPAFSIARSAGRYEGVLRTLVHALKYEGRRLLARPLADLMQHGAAGVLEGADAVVPVPLHPWRRLRRGFNQSDDLAQCLGPPVWRLLARTRLGAPQADLPASRRHANVRDAFRLRRGWGWTGPFAAARLTGCVIVLIDDVMTTGATLDACARVLRRAGVSDVRALTVARTVAGPPARRPWPPRLSAVPRR